VVVGSHAWACVPNSGSHTGFTWICKATSTVTCNYDGGLNPADGRNLSPTHNLSFYSQAKGHTNNGSYNVKYVTGAHSSDTDFACNNGTTFTGGANIIASSTGSWSGKGPILIPNATGVHTVCTMPLPGNDSRNFLVSQHTIWTFM
jgi:hypothetical protein